MNLTPVFILQFFFKFWFLWAVLIILVFLKTPFFKGFIGEVLINIITKFFLDKNKYHLLKNITLPTEDGTTQIDHIIVSTYGIFVVETKNMKGWIYGNERQKMWTQVIYKHKSKFKNPIHQNYKHLKTLEKLLNVDSNKLFSVIVFLGGVTFKTKMPANVNYPMGYLNYIKSKNEILFSEAQVDEIISFIESGRLNRSFKTDREHVKHVKTIIQKKQNDVTCPKCGSPMILRTGKKGPNVGTKFWGCSNFPKCRNTLEYSQN